MSLLILSLKFSESLEKLLLVLLLKVDGIAGDNEERAEMIGCGLLDEVEELDDVKDIEELENVEGLIIVGHALLLLLLEVDEIATDNEERTEMIGCALLLDEVEELDDVKEVEELENVEESIIVSHAYSKGL